MDPWAGAAPRAMREDIAGNIASRSLGSGDINDNDEKEYRSKGAKTASLHIKQQPVEDTGAMYIM